MYVLFVLDEMSRNGHELMTYTNLVGPFNGREAAMTWGEISGLYHVPLIIDHDDLPPIIREGWTYGVRVYLEGRWSWIKGPFRSMSDAYTWADHHRVEHYDIVLFADPVAVSRDL